MESFSILDDITAGNQICGPVAQQYVQFGFICPQLLNVVTNLKMKSQICRKIINTGNTTND